MQNIKDKILKLKEESKLVQKEIKRLAMSYILAGLGVVVGFAWNEAIKELIEYIFPFGKNTLLAKFGYAIFLTLIIVLVSLYIAKIFEEKKE